MEYLNGLPQFKDTVSKTLAVPQPDPTVPGSGWGCVCVQNAAVVKDSAMPNRRQHCPVAP